MLFKFAVLSAGLKFKKHTSFFYSETPGFAKKNHFLGIHGGAAVKGSMAARAGDAPPGPRGGTMPPS